MSCVIDNVGICVFSIENAFDVNLEAGKASSKGGFYPMIRTTLMETPQGGTGRYGSKVYARPSLMAVP
ncbi:hypothetical protein PRECH8_02250 [Insulibacter thermoxylanivorax]|uniref:Uncharacterized protein n=1 Tax=Insulibacter thermoxylanivorax TaxID=2749268 RepID=A0A916QCB2_9BACL|nr:hypothetical protein PRECH8_02250 [Insulibacter thermoxylanivorax]